MRYASRLDYFLFNELFVREGLALSRFANGIQFHPYRPLAAYLRAGRVVVAWHGYARCRFRCWTPRRKLGSSDLTDGVYIWPEGLAHYVEKHHVKPPAGFLHHVREQLRQRAAAPKSG